LPTTEVGGSVVVGLPASSPSSRGSTTASVGSLSEILVGISRRPVRLVEIGQLMPHASNFDTFDNCKEEECLKMVSGLDGHQEVVRSTVEVAMVFMASNGTPTGVSRSRSTEEIIFYYRVG